jgi:hypothetical protein
LRITPPTEGFRLDVDVTALRDGSQWRRASGRTAIFVRGAPPEIVSFRQA